MNELETIYTNNINIRSDINEHLKTLQRYSSECNHVTEFGVREGTSLCSLVIGKPNIIKAYDIHLNLFKYNKEILDYCSLNNMYFSIDETDVLLIDIDETDLLFIDTLHTYNQLKSELNRHSNKVKKYIIMHDTTTFSRRDEYVYNHASSIIKNMDQHTQGLMTAIDEFLTINTFKIKEKFDNNNGLVVLERT